MSYLQVLGWASWTLLPAVLPAQTVTPRADAPATLSRSTTMTLRTVQDPAPAPVGSTWREDPVIRPFRIKVSDAALADLRRRILATQ